MIIHIHKDTRQKNFFDELANVAGQDGHLTIIVRSLPIYLSTKIAFSILSYRLRNYPRKIIWVSEDDKILELLMQSEVEVDHKYFDSKPELTYTEPVVEALSNSSDSEVKVKDELDQSTKELLEQFGSVEISIDDLQDSSDMIEVSAAVANDEEKNAPNEELPVFSQSEVNKESESYDVSNFQNLDSWLERIEATKMALDYMKREDVERIFGVKDFFDNQKFSANSTIQRINSKRPKSFRFLTAFFASAVFLILLLVSFPTDVFTLEVVPQEIEESISLSIPTSAFSKKTVKISKEANKDASGVTKDTTERATGKVRLINNTFEDISLSESSFYLEKGQNKYYYYGDSTLSGEFVLPANNERSKEIVEIGIQAENSGVEYNVSPNERLELYNLFGQKLCDNCFAMTTTSVAGDVITGGKVVTEADQELLRTTIEGLLAAERLKEVDALSDDNVFTNPAWYKNIDSVFVYNKALGDVAKNLSLQVDVTTTIYYLPKSTIEEILENENSQIDELKRVELKDYSGSFTEDDAEIDLDYLYSYTKKSEIDEREVREKLSQSEENIKELHTDYPNVRRVQKKELGLNIPFVPKRVDINIVEAE